MDYKLIEFEIIFTYYGDENLYCLKYSAQRMVNLCIDENSKNYWNTIGEEIDDFVDKFHILFKFFQFLYIFDRHSICI